MLGVAVAGLAVEVCETADVVGLDAFVVSNEFGPADELAMVAAATLSFEGIEGD